MGAAPQRAAAAASAEAPLAWLRLEPAQGRFEVRLTLWPGGDDRLLATATGHGRGREVAGMKVLTETSGCTPCACAPNDAGRVLRAPQERALDPS
jgi:hypothetical protein